MRIGGEAGGCRGRTPADLPGSGRTSPWRRYAEPSVARRFDRLAPFYWLLEIGLALPLGIRRRAVGCLDLSSGAAVLEVGVGTGRNLKRLAAAVGPGGSVHGIDISRRMLARADAVRRKVGLRQVSLHHVSATDFVPSAPLDAILFSLSYGIMPNGPAVLAHLWEYLKPGGRVVIMDARLPGGVWRRILYPFALLANRIVLGDPDHQSWRDLALLTDDVTVEPVQFHTYYICRATKRPH
jgi:ubiquinone/menaquinone biosynthesis C-methylase UbiE